MSRTWEEKQAVLRVISFKALTSPKLWRAASESAGWWKSHQHQSHSQNVSYPLGSAQCPAGERNELGREIRVEPLSGAPFSSLFIFFSAGELPVCLQLAVRPLPLFLVSGSQHDLPQRGHGALDLSSDTGHHWLYQVSVFFLFWQSFSCWMW